MAHGFAGRADEISSEYAYLASVVAEHVMADPASLRLLAGARLGEAADSPLEDLNVSPAECKLLESLHVGPEERSELGHLPSEIDDVLPGLAEHVSEWVWQNFTGRDNVLLMSSFRAVAEGVRASLASRLRPDELGLSVSGRPDGDNAEDAARFTSTKTRATCSSATHRQNKASTYRQPID